LQKIFLGVYAAYIQVIRDTNIITEYKIRMLIDELRSIILNTSPVERGEYTRELQEIKPAESDNFISRMQVKIINAHIALQFAEIEPAKKKYLEIIAEYEKMNEKDEEVVFLDIQRLYNSTIYVNSWAWHEGKI